MKTSLIIVTLLASSLGAGAMPSALGAGPAAAGAAEQAPGTTRVREVNAALEALLRAKPAAGSAEEKRIAAEIEKTVDGFLDVAALGQSALTDHWEKLTPAQRKQFSELLSELVRSSYVRALRSNLDYEVEYRSEKREARGLMVATEVSAQQGGRSQRISIDYVLKERDGAFRAVDVITDGVGLVENYRAQFNKIISKEGFSGLLGRMRKKADAG